MLKTYQFITHCKGDSHSSKTANIILPGLMIKQRWTSASEMVFKFIELHYVGWNNSSHRSWTAYYISVADVRTFTFVLSWVLAKWYLQF